MRHASTFSQRCRGSFDARSRERGVEYDRQRRVKVYEDERTRVAGMVRGTADYAVTVTLAEQRGTQATLEVACACPRFADGVHCKHLYSLFCRLDRTRSVFTVPGSGSIRLRRGGLDPVDLADSAAGAHHDYERDLENLVRPRAPSQPRVAPDARWLLHLRAESASQLSLPEGELLFAVTRQAFGEDLWVQLMRRRHNKSGAWSPPRETSIPTAQLASYPEPDRAALLALAGCKPHGYSSYYDAEALARRVLPEGLQALVIPLLAGTGRLCEIVDGQPRRLGFDPDPITVLLRAERGEGAGALRVSAALRGAGLAEPQQLRWVLKSGLALADDRFVRLADPRQHALVVGFREHGSAPVPALDAPALIERLSAAGSGAIEGLAELGWESTRGTPDPALRVRKPNGIHESAGSLLYAEIRFAYDATLVSRNDWRAVLVDPVARRIVHRDLAREEALARDVFAAGCAPLPPSSLQRDEADVQLPRRALTGVAEALIARGWRVEAEGIPLRRASARRLSVKSGLDWFDLEAHVEFGGERVPLPELLAAVVRGERTVLLGDGSHGLLPEEWLARVAPLSELGEATESGVRFGAQQALLLDALLASEPEVDADAAFREACARLSGAGEPRPRDAASGFAGTLREYQREGLGWLHYLGEARIGACLADDMGLGKTVQVLALLAEQASAASNCDARPSLVVAPSSVVPNWLAEAARFAPGLRVLDFTGAERGEKREQISAHDLVVTSYGTLRAEIEKLAGVRFATVALDEAQAIKNAASKTAQAARLLGAERRIALSGTPVENHLGELWSLFDFLNPGLLGKSTRSVRVLDDLGAAGVAALAKAVRPFILRRTKDQVLRELPAKTEQSLVCELPGAQRRLYDELLRHYRASVLGEVEKRGLGRAKIQVLEALLRLRQAACHPALIDPRRAKDGSAKLDLLMEQLEATLAEGHKALVFSQFTSLLALVRERLDARGLVYEYLDGRTRDRAPRVARFQEDASCPLFLISLKAGGLGLNLTAADTVYLLDPWWNPAVEAQAVDRAHRIGQTKPVNAYRLVAKDTIEEKILALQERKRALADAVINADASVLRTLTREDLEMLLG